MQRVGRIQTHAYALPADVRVDKYNGGNFGARLNPPQRAELLAAKAKEIAQLKAAGLDPSNLMAAIADAFLDT